MQAIPSRQVPPSAAARLAPRSEIVRVLHAERPGSFGFAHWRASCDAAAGLFSVEFTSRYACELVDACVDALKLFHIGCAWAGPVSLVVPHHVRGMRSRSTPCKGVLVRFSNGFEAVADLQGDLQRAPDVAVGHG